MRRGTGLSGGQEGSPLKALRNYCKRKGVILHSDRSWARAAARGLSRGGGLSPRRRGGPGAGVWERAEAAASATEHAGRRGWRPEGSVSVRELWGAVGALRSGASAAGPVVMDSGGGGRAAWREGRRREGHRKSPPRWPGRSGSPGRGRAGIRRWSPPDRELAPTRPVAVENLPQLGGFDPCTS